MRPALRLYAAVKPGRYLEAGAPTGLTGLFTHPSPRSHLLFVYASILEKLEAFPESSIYRQSTEALTKHRMNIIEQIKPAGYEEWQKRAMEAIEKHPGILAPGNSQIQSEKAGKYVYVGILDRNENDELEWDGETGPPTEEGEKGEKEARLNALQAGRQDVFHESSDNWEPEPALEATQYVYIVPL